jgi:hypothetical protein
LKAKKEKYLSASRIKTLETCSWVYWCKYHLHLPDTPNDGALRGTICHLVFELLLDKKHRKHYDAILKESSIEGSPAVQRLILNFLEKHDILKDRPDDNYELIDKMILVGLHNDFFGSGGKLMKAETAFKFENKRPIYNIVGFIDKCIKYTKEKRVKIVDYKSSKYKFRGDDLESNIQALMYSLAAKKMWKGYKPVVEFLFLRFPKSPLQTLEFSDEEIKGFEHYLVHMHKVINNFSKKDATCNWAIDDPKSRWMCGIGKWVCPMKKAFKFYVLLDKDKKVLISSFTRTFVNRDGVTVEPAPDQNIEERKYDGCPRFKHEVNKEDPFDLG